MLLQYAETSLDYSKNHGKNRLTFFSPENYEERLRELELREDLKKVSKQTLQVFHLFFKASIIPKPMNSMEQRHCFATSHPGEGMYLP